MRDRLGWAQPTSVCRRLDDAQGSRQSIVSVAGVVLGGVPFLARRSRPRLRPEGVVGGAMSLEVKYDERDRLSSDGHAVREPR